MKEETAPHYSQAEEVCNSATHIIGGLLTIVGVCLLVLDSRKPSYVASALIYGVTIFSMFLASSLYHAIRDRKAKAVVRKIDHAAIYFAIAGTYVPVLTVIASPRECAIWNAGLGLCAVVGAASSFVTLKHKYVTTAVYLVMGWASLLLLRNLWGSADHLATYLLVGGGVAYSVGAALYLIKKPFIHAVFHIFVVLGVVLQYLAILTLYLHS